MPQYKLPLSVDEQQHILDAANPYDVPVLLDLLVRCQEVMIGVRLEIKAAKHYRMGSEVTKHTYNALEIINRLIGP